jgi:serine/threonine protein kinase
MSELVGRQLGQYQLRELVRQGGMATVYKAHQPSLDRWVAVKVLDRPDDPQFVARFGAEARAIARFQHPNIIPVHDYGEQDGHLYLVVTYVEDGRSLSDMVGDPMPPARALGLGIHLLAGLGYAHERGVVHRDIKPANVLLPTPDWPMLADFGIAKLLLEGGEGLTQTGMVVGTAAYMAPEQAFGLKVDQRTDLYAVGVVLYELVTGRVPFDDETPMMVLMKQAYEPPEPARSVNPDLPVEVDHLLTRALAKEPGERFQSAEEMTLAIRTALGELPARPAPVAGPPDPLAAAYGAGVAAYSAGRWAEAIEHLAPIAAADPDYEDVEALLESAIATRKSESGQRLRLEDVAGDVRQEPAATGARVGEQRRSPDPEGAASRTQPARPPVSEPADPAVRGAAARGEVAAQASVQPPPTAPAGEAARHRVGSSDARTRGAHAPATPAADHEEVTRFWASAGATVGDGGQAGGPSTADPTVPREGVPARPPAAGRDGPRSPRRRRQLIWGAGAVAAAVAVAAVVLALREPGADPPPATRANRPTTSAPKPQAWTALAAAPFGLESAGVATFDGQIWNAGGFDDRRRGRASVLLYDPEGDSWSNGPDLPEPLTHATLVSTGDVLFLIGGYSGSTTTPITTVLRLERGSSTWVQAPDLPVPLGAGAAVWDGRRVVYGGGVTTGGKPSEAVFALEDGSWRRVGDLSRAREHLAAVSDGKGLTYFLAGEVNDSQGKTVHADVDVVTTNRVRRIGKVPTPRGSVAGFWSPTDGACAAGGRDGEDGLYGTVECLRLDGAAKRLPDLPTKRHGLGAAVVDGTVYALMGSDNRARTFRTGESLPLES